jgi:hypothetical protein
MRKSPKVVMVPFRMTVPWRRIGGDVRSMSLERIVAEGDARDRQYDEIARRPAIAKVLLNHGRPPEDVTRIANMLTLEGLAYRIPLKVVSDPKLLAEHYRLETEGLDGRRLALTYIVRFGYAT